MQALNNVEILKRVLVKAKTNDPDWQPLLLDHPKDLIQMGHENMVLFNRGFARAFWGEAPCTILTASGGDAWGQANDTPAWRYHLQELAMAPDLFAYLAKFL